MFDNQQQNQNRGNTGGNIPEGKTMKFKYRPPSFYSIRLIIAKYEINVIEDFFDRAKEAWRKGQQALEQKTASSGANVPDDWLFDDVTQLKEFSWLYAEFAIIGLWRCIELYEAEAKGHIRRHKQSAMRAALNIIKDENKKIRCALSVNELRCLNNAIKHRRRVQGELTKLKLPRWKNKEGDKLGDLECHYLRLLPFAKKYLEDLTKRLNKVQDPSAIPAGQVGKT